MKTIIVTGGAGFIGSNYARYVLANTDYRVVVVDKLTYAGSLESVSDLQENTRFHFERADICDAPAIAAILKKYRPRSLVNFAAETHVDRSIDGPSAFVQTNFVGVAVLLEQAKLIYDNQYSKQERENFRFLQVSTDEVYGSLGETGAFHEKTSYDPNSPYSATKAGADHLASSYFRTYRFPVLITNCSNNYGPYQFPEKLIPLMILNLLDGKELPIYGDGKNVRDWLYVEDHCSGIHLVLDEGEPGEKYNIGGSNEKQNIEVIETLCEVLESLRPAAKNESLLAKGVSAYKDLKKYVADRPGHDRRYAIDASKITKELGWRAEHNFKSGIQTTVAWYLDHLDWCNSVQKNNYERERLGLEK